MKVTVVGAGAVGASCAEYIAIKNFASEVVILDIKDGFLHAPQNPGIGTRLKKDVKERKDVHIRVSDLALESHIDAWELFDTHGSGGKVMYRSKKMEEELKSLRIERNPFIK